MTEDPLWKRALKYLAFLGYCAVLYWLTQRNGV